MPLRMQSYPHDHDDVLIPDTGSSGERRNQQTKNLLVSYLSSGGKRRRNSL